MQQDTELDHGEQAQATPDHNADVETPPIEPAPAVLAGGRRWLNAAPTKAIPLLVSLSSIQRMVDPAVSCVLVLGLAIEAESDAEM